MGIGPLLEMEFSKWLLESKWPPFIIKNVIVDYVNTSYRICLKLYRVKPYRHKINFLEGIFKMAAKFKMAAIFVKNIKIFFDNSNISDQICLKFWRVIHYRHKIDDLEGIFNMVAIFKMATIFVKILK